MSFGVFSSWFPSSNTVSCVEAVYFVSFLHEVAITPRIVHTVVWSTNNIYAYKSAICLIMFWQKDPLHSADAKTITVDSFRRDLWMFLYEVYFVWLPTLYFHCAGCAHLCPGLRSLGGGWLWDECSTGLLGSCKPLIHMSLITRVPGDMWVRMMSKSVSLSLCLRAKAGFGLAADAAKKPLSFDVSSFVPISRWSSLCPRQCIATIFSRTRYCGCVPCSTVCTGRDPPKFRTI